MPKSFSTCSRCLSSVSPTPSYAVAVGFLTQVESYFYLYLWSFAWEGEACMQVCVCWCVHSCFLLHQSQVLGPHTAIPRQLFLGSCNLTHLFHLLFSKRNRDQVLWQ